MPQLPNEIWAQICEYLEPKTLLNLQRVARVFLKIARDPALWKSKVFENSPSAVHAFANGDSLSRLLDSLSLTGPASDNSNNVQQPEVRLSRRSRAIANWDCTDAHEAVDWYSEYIARHAALSTQWQPHPYQNEIRSLALFDEEQKVLGAMEDGSIMVWDINRSANERRKLYERASSTPGVLCQDMFSDSGPSSLKLELNIGSAVDSTMVRANKAYIAVGNTLNEIDLKSLSVVSQQTFAWPITAISQQSGDDLPLMVGTSFTLDMYDPRMPSTGPNTLSGHTDKLDNIVKGEQTVFLPNYAKRWLGHQARPYGFTSSNRRQQPSFNDSSRGTTGTHSRQRRRSGNYASIEPGPQTILHYGQNEIVVAGRMPSILFYDKRTFPRLQSVIHSGARLSALTTMPYQPHGATSSTAQATLVAAGEYHGRGSLELYELPHQRSSDRPASYDNPEDSQTSDDPINIDSNPSDPSNPEEPYKYRNRQSSSSAKLLSVAAQGARIVFSDSEGTIKWVERDGRGLARRWNINPYTFSHTSGTVVGDSVARKILTFSSDDKHTSRDRYGMTRGDGDLLIWTGSEIGIVTSKVEWAGHDELIAAFERSMSLEEADSPEGAARRKNEEEARMREEYSRVMRSAFERQADERRFLARFGRMGGW